MELARIVALADNGHTLSYPCSRSRRTNRVALRLVPFGENFYVLRARQKYADLLGASLIFMDDKPIAEVFAVARTLAGGKVNRRDRFADYFRESPEQMHELAVIVQSDRALYTFQKPIGEIVARLVTPEAAKPNRPGANAD